MPESVPYSSLSAQRLSERTVLETLHSISYKRGDDTVVFLSDLTHRVYTECTRINRKIVPVTNLNTYLHYGTSGNECVL
jgi:hypothetical protein